MSHLDKESAGSEVEHWGATLAAKVWPPKTIKMAIIAFILTQVKVSVNDPAKYSLDLTKNFKTVVKIQP